MNNKQFLTRVARVKFSSHPLGKSYWMQCDREDIIVGSDVDVEMYFRTPEKGYQYSGVVTEVDLKPFDCSCRVIGLSEERDCGF